MAELKLLKAPATPSESLYALVSELSDDEQLTLAYLIMSAHALKQREPERAAKYGVHVTFILEEKARAYADDSPPQVDASTAGLAGELLALKTGLNGPERALIAAVKLYHQGELVINSRRINEANDEMKGDFIPNITTAVASNTKLKFLKELKQNGHSTYEVTRTGFTEFDRLFQEKMSSGSNLKVAKP